LGDWYLFYAALLTIVALLLNPDGIAARQAEHFAALRAKITRRREGPKWDVGAVAAREVVPMTLELRNLGVRFRNVIALEGVSLTVRPGRVLGLIGPNGAGKTTLVDAVTGFIRGYQGTIAVDGESVASMSSVRRARIGLTRSFQSLELFEDLTVADNLRTASDSRDGAAYLTDLVHPGRARLSPQAVTAIREFELEPYLNKLPRELPYAQRRLVGIARAVAAGPSILLLDEPAAGLDQQSTKELARLIRRLASEWGMAILMIEHDVQMVLGLCDDVVVLDFGQVLAVGPPDEIRRNPAVIAAYLGATETEEARELEQQHAEAVLTAQSAVRDGGSAS
jgi:ABC-type branched-subunit amino acid transport system ATPase component